MNNIVIIASCAIFGYLLGSIPFGLIITKIFGYGDIRKIGSGNIGATNVLRTGNKGLAIATLLLDAIKGTIAIIITQLVIANFYANVTYNISIAAMVGLAAIIGHCFPLWLSFNGGKGVASFIGVITILYWPLGLIAVAVWLLMARIFNISSLAALIMVTVTPIIAIWLINKETAFIITLCSIIIIIRHYQNILRLLSGTEPHIKKVPN